MQPFPRPGISASHLNTVFMYACLLLLSVPARATGTYQTGEEFLGEAFAGDIPASRTIWLKGDIRKATSEILGHRYPAIRIRYWLQGSRSAWILEETGKEKPITAGLLINSSGIERLRVLTFRESRGWEVRHPFFTDQFTGIGLTPDHRLNGQIDGISGATLSVRALKKLAQLALYLHKQVVTENDPTP